MLFRLYIKVTHNLPSPLLGLRGEQGMLFYMLYILLEAIF